MLPDNKALIEFIDRMKGQGVSDEFIVSLLKQNGWSEKRIYQAFGSWYELRTGNVVPSGGGRMEAAKDAFLYLLAFLTLGIWTFQLGALLFAAIDRTFPNPAVDYAPGPDATITTANQLASILIGLPLFLILSRGISRGLQQQPERIESPVRKWLTYLALVITASTLIGDGVTFLAYLLRGDLDTRFVLKVATLLVIAGGVFAYYLDSLRWESVSASHNRAFALAAVALAGFGVVVGFIGLGSPATQRVVAEDGRRLYDLSMVAGTMHQKWVQRDQKDFVPPATLAELKGTGTAWLSITDPVTGHPYEYRRLGGFRYEVCAEFAKPAPVHLPGRWQHGAGRACFALEASENVEGIPRPPR
jgi:hypothetical protein